MDKTTEFTKGDKVRTKFGNTEMIVVRLIGSEKEDEFVFIDARGYETGDVVCEWADSENHTKTDIFKRSSLELIKNKE